MKRFLPRLARENRGAAVIELAMIAPILAVMVIGVVDMSNGFGRKLQLEQAAQRSLEMVLQTTGEDTAEAAIKTEVVDEAGVTIDDVQVVRRKECDGVETADLTLPCGAGQIDARYFVVTVSDKYEPMFPLHFAGLNEDGTYHLTAQAGMRIK